MDKVTPEEPDNPLTAFPASPKFSDSCSREFLLTNYDRRYS